jgi:hypothetical protein
MRVERAKGAILDTCWKHCLIVALRRQPPLRQPPLGCQPVDRMRDWFAPDCILRQRVFRPPGFSHQLREKRAFEISDCHRQEVAKPLRCRRLESLRGFNLIPAGLAQSSFPWPVSHGIGGDCTKHSRSCTAGAFAFILWVHWIYSPSVHRSGRGVTCGPDGRTACPGAMRRQQRKICVVSCLRQLRIRGAVSRIFAIVSSLRIRFLRIR